MKNLLAAALLFITVSTSAFTPDPDKVNSIFQRTFDIEFPEASNVSWLVKNDFVKATFTLDDEPMTALFNLDADLIATCKNISLDDLPVNAKRTFAKRFEGYTVTEAIRFNGKDEGAYYISAENEKEAIIVKVNDFGQLSTFQRTKK